MHRQPGSVEAHVKMSCASTASQARSAGHLSQRSATAATCLGFKSGRDLERQRSQRLLAADSVDGIVQLFSSRDGLVQLVVSRSPDHYQPLDKPAAQDKDHLSPKARQQILSRQDE